LRREAAFKGRSHARYLAVSLPPSRHDRAFISLSILGWCVREMNSCAASNQAELGRTNDDSRLAQMQRPRAASLESANPSHLVRGIIMCWAGKSCT
jgi:hypothetical protein